MEWPEFSKLFEDIGSNALQHACETWWKNAATARMAYERLWFKHFRSENRIPIAMAHAFAEAYRLGLLRCDAEGNYLAAPGEDPVDGCRACDVLVRLWNLGLKALVQPTGICLAGGGLSTLSPGEPAVTFLWVKDLPPSAPDDQWEQALEETFANLSKSPVRDWRLIWLTPETTVPGGLQAPARVDAIRDALGMPHWGSGETRIALRFDDTDIAQGRIPTMLDGCWAFFRPADPSDGWGQTLPLDPELIPLKEGVVSPVVKDWVGHIVAEDNTKRPVRYQPETRHIRGLNRWEALCEELLNRS